MLVSCTIALHSSLIGSDVTFRVRIDHPLLEQVDVYDTCDSDELIRIIDSDFDEFFDPFGDYLPEGYDLEIDYPRIVLPRNKAGDIELPKILSDKAYLRQMQAFISTLKSYRMRAQRSYLTTAAELVQHMKMEIAGILRITIIHDEERDVLPTLAEVKIRDLATRYAEFKHDICLAIQLDDETSRIFIDIIGDQFDYQLMPGNNYMNSLDLLDILNKQYYYHLGEKYRLEVVTEEGQAFPSIMQEDDYFAMLGRTYGLYPFAAKKTEPGSYLAERELELSEIIHEDGYLGIVWKPIHQGHTWQDPIVRSSEKEFIAYLQAYQAEFGIYPVDRIRDRVINWDRDYLRIERYILNLIEDNEI